MNSARFVLVAVAVAVGLSASCGGSNVRPTGGASDCEQQCASTHAVAICSAGGQPGTPWPCATGACKDGACSGATTTGASCQAGGDGMTNCGASSESCCTSLEVPGGTYYRTYDPIDESGGIGTATDGGPSGEANPATVSGFRLDKYLVTVGRFRQFVDAWRGGSGYMPAAGSGKHAHLNGGQGLVNSAVAGAYETGWLASDDASVAPSDGNLACNPTNATWTSMPGKSERLPITCVNWWEAYAFCIWDGGFLPSEAEWELAAAGGREQREYPWGSADAGGTNEYAIYDCLYPPGSMGLCSNTPTGQPPNIAPVGTATAGAGAWGQLDLGGTVWEWNLDGYSSYVDPCVDCAYMSAASARVWRGGAFNLPAFTMVPSGRYSSAPGNRGGNDVGGFRCARSP